MSPAPSGNSAEFGRLRSYVWPVHAYELKKLIPLLLIFFLISFNYNILRPMKDSLVVTSKASGAEVIPFIKVWVLFPSAIALTLLYTVLASFLDREKVFYAMMGLFLGFFGLFAFVIYPNRELLHPHATADFLQSILPQGFKWIIAMFRNWSFTIFYVMAELWGTIIFFVLIWGFANQVTRLNEARRFYGLLGIGANFSGVFAGKISMLLSNRTFNPDIPLGSDAWEQSLMIIMGFVMLSGLAAMTLFYWFNRVVLTDPRFAPEETPEQKSFVKGKEARQSLRDSFRYIIRSRYLICIALVMISYNAVINLVEVMWKNEMRQVFTSAGEFNAYMSEVTYFVGWVATLSALFISGNSIRRLGWTWTAMMTPCILLVTSIAFFGSFFLKEAGWGLGGLALLVGSTPATLVVFFGSLQNVMSRAAKYTVFDATKEMAFIPLSYESKVRGKAAIDGVCSRMGKSTGSLIYQGLFFIVPSVAAAAPFVAGFLVVIIVVWMGATRLLGQEFNQLTRSPTASLAHPVTLSEDEASQPVTTNSLVPAVVGPELTRQQAI